MPEQESTFQDYERYITDLFAAEDEALRSTREAMARENIPRMYVSPSEGRLLEVLARGIGARRILEIGTLGGYSTLWLARALPAGGRLISLEIEERHAAVARRSLAMAGTGEKVEVRLGPARETLARMHADGEEAFDLVFIDADKEGYPGYLEQSVPLTRPGGLILADNTLSHSALDPDRGRTPHSEQQRLLVGAPTRVASGIARFNAAAAAHPQLVSIIVPVLRGRGIDGLLIALKSA
jgi:predicted O-methyltransferase YrrM